MVRSGDTGGYGVTGHGTLHGAGKTGPGSGGEPGDATLRSWASFRAAWRPDRTASSAAPGVSRRPSTSPTTTTSGGSRSRDDTRLFEKLCLEGFQSGLSWLTILRKREAFRRAFAGFDSDAVARFGASATSSGCSPTPASSATAARSSPSSTTPGAALDLRDEAGSLAAHVWSFEPAPRGPPAPAQLGRAPAPWPRRPSRRRSASDLRKRGWSFVGPTDRLRLHAGDGAGERPPRPWCTASGRGWNSGAPDLPAAASEESPMTSSRLPVLLLAAVLVVLAWSGIAPRDRGTWVLEIAPALVGHAHPRRHVPALPADAARLPAPDPCTRSS